MNGSSFEQTWIPLTQGCTVAGFVEIVPVVLEKKSMCFCFFVIISPWKRAGPFISPNLGPLHPRMFCVKFGLKLVQWFWRRRFINFVNIFLLFHNYPPLKRAWPFIWTNVNPLYPRILCAKFEIGPVVLEKIFKFHQCIVTIS